MAGKKAAASTVLDQGFERPSRRFNGQIWYPRTLQDIRDLLESEQVNALLDSVPMLDIDIWKDRFEPLLAFESTLIPCLGQPETLPVIIASDQESRPEIVHQDNKEDLGLPIEDMKHIIPTVCPQMHFEDEPPEYILPW